MCEGLIAIEYDSKRDAYFSLKKNTSVHPFEDFRFTLCVQRERRHKMARHNVVRPQTVYLFIERASQLFARLLRFIKSKEIILSMRCACPPRGFTGPPDRREKKAESKFKGNREERRLELSFSRAASSVPLTPTNERAVIKGTLAVVCTKARRNKRDARHKAAPRTDGRADSCGTTRAFS